MILVTIWRGAHTEDDMHSRNGEDDCFVLTASGHAGYAHAGADIVCAGVSSLLYALLGYLQKTLRRNGDKLLPFSLEYEDRPGYMRIKVEGELPAAALEMAETGLEQLAGEYPENVRIYYCLR